MLESGVNCVVAPLEDADSLARGVEGCDVVFHLAGAVDLSGGWDLCRRANVQGTANLLQAAKAAGVRRVVHVSSIVAVGANRDRVVLDETALWNLGPCEVPYVTTKHEAEELALRAIGSPEVVVVNPGCVVGPDDFGSSEFGTLCNRFWRGRIPIYFAGGSNFVDVRDVADGIALAAMKGKSGERYLLGGENVSFDEFFSMLARIAGQRILRLRVPTAVAKIGGRIADCLPRRERSYLSATQARLVGLYFYFDSGKARRQLGFNPRPLIESLQDAHKFWMSK